MQLIETGEAIAGRLWFLFFGINQERIVEVKSSVEDSG